MARSRKPENEWLQSFPGLYMNRYGVFFVVHPKTGRRATLDTKDRPSAIRRWTAISQSWEKEINQWRSDLLVAKISALSTPHDPEGEMLLCDYMSTWRKKELGHELVDGKNVWSECRLTSLRGGGKPLALSTKRDYASDCQQLEASGDAKFALSDPDLLRKLRKLLSPWLDKPTHYNGLRNTINRVYIHAVKDGTVQRNPMIDLRKAVVPKRNVLVPNDAYIAITTLLCVHRHNRRIMDGTWRAKICDLIYMMSQQPIDVFDIEEGQGEIYSKPVTVDDELIYGVISFARHKTEIGVELSMNKELAELWQWFIKMKKKEQIISPFLLVNPRYFDKRSRAEPATHRTLQEAWRKACKAAGYSGLYHLSDLRKKGLTEEYVTQGENDKGGHKTQIMADHYRLIKPPKRARSTIKFLRKEANQNEGAG
jgi:hypothetical protein